MSLDLMVNGIYATIVVFFVLTLVGLIAHDLLARIVLIRSCE